MRYFLRKWLLLARDIPKRTKIGRVLTFDNRCFTRFHSIPLTVCKGCGQRLTVGVPSNGILGVTLRTFYCTHAVFSIASQQSLGHSFA
jgi:hypothetical protein